MSERNVILSMPAAEAEWFGESDVPEDSPELRLHAKRSWMVPDLIRFRVCSGSLEWLGPSDFLDQMAPMVELEQGVEEALANEDFGAALASLGRLLEINPHCRPVRERLVRVLRHLERYQEAFDATLDGLRLDPQYPIFHSLMGHCLIALDEHKNQAVAEESIRRAVEFGSVDPLDYAILSRIASYHGNHREALELAEQALNFDPHSLHGLHSRALAIVGIDSSLEAATAFEAAASVIPTDQAHQMEERDLPKPYLFCCRTLLESANRMPWSRVEREIARIEAEFGWSVDFRVTEDMGYDGAGEDAPPEGIKHLEWLDARAPGTVRFHFNDDPRTIPVSALLELSRVRIEARHQKCHATSRSPAELHRLSEQVESLVRTQLKRILPGKLPMDAPEELVPALEGMFTMLVTSPLESLAVLETLGRYPDLRHPLVAILAHECGIFRKTIDEFDDDSSGGAYGDGDWDADAGGDDELLSELTMALTQPLMLAKMLFLADLSRGVVNDAIHYRHLPSWPRALQIHDHFRQYLRLPAKKQRPDQLLLETATIAGFLTSPTPIHTQGTFW